MRMRNRARASIKNVVQRFFVILKKIRRIGCACALQLLALIVSNSLVSLYGAVLTATTCVGELFDNVSH